MDNSAFDQGFQYKALGAQMLFRDALPRGLRRFDRSRFGWYNKNFLLFISTIFPFSF